MTVTVSAANGAGSFTPIDMIVPYAATRAGRNVVHSLVGGGVAVSFVDADPRTGTVRYLFTDEQAAFDAALLHAGSTSFTVTNTDRATVSMTYVVAGGIAVSLDEQTLSVWLLEVDFQEVVP